MKQKIDYTDYLQWLGLSLLGEITNNTNFWWIFWEIKHATF